MRTATAVAAAAVVDIAIALIEESGERHLQRAAAAVGGDVAMAIVPSAQKGE
jgi:hypothetical protein